MIAPICSRAKWIALILHEESFEPLKHCLKLGTLVALGTGGTGQCLRLRNVLTLNLSR